MKVVIIHQHFNTPEAGGPLRSWYLGKALARAGFKVVIITGNAAHQKRVTTLDGMEIYYLGVPYDNRFSFYKRIRSFMRFTFQAYGKAAGLRDVGVCYAISVPLTVGLVALWLRKFRNIPYYFEVGDLWPDAPIELGFIRNSLLKSFLLSLEKRIYRHANKVIALSPAIAERVRAKVDSVPVEVITNFSDVRAFRPEPKKAELLLRYNLKPRFTISYIGAVGFANGLDYFLECCRVSMQAGLEVNFIICGEGAMLPSLKKSARILQLDNLTFVPFQNRVGVADVLNITDAAFICYRYSPILETGSPNKYFDGLAAGKLIVLNFSGWIRREVEAEKCGVFVDPSRPSSFVDVIKPFVSNHQLLLEYQRNSRNLAEQKYSREKLGEKFVRLFFPAPV